MSEQREVAWGLESRPGGAGRLVRVERGADGFVVTDASAGSPPDPHGLDGPMAVCLGEAFVAHRTLRLPAAGEADTRRMIAAQASALAGGQADTVAHGWWSGGGADAEGRRRVTLAVARSEAVAAGASGLNGTPEAIEPATMGLARLWLVGDPGALPLLLVHVGVGQSDCVIVDERGPRAVTTVDVGSDGWDRPGGLDAWADHLREAWGDLCEQSAGERAPARCLLSGGSDRASSCLSVAVDLPVSRRPLPPSIRVRGEVDPEDLAPAVGAALGLLCDDWPSVDLRRADAAGESAGQPARRWWPWALVGAWLTAALAGMMWVDIARARRLDERFADARSRLSANGGLQRRLQMGRVLEGGVPGPLDMLDRLGTLLPKSMILSRVTYERSGEVILSGTVAEPKDVAATLEALKALGEVELQRTGPENDRRRIDVRVLLGPGSRPASRAKSVDQAAPDNAAASAGAASPDGGATPPDGGARDPSDKAGSPDGGTDSPGAHVEIAPPTDGETPRDRAGDEPPASPVPDPPLPEPTDSSIDVLSPCEEGG